MTDPQKDLLKAWDDQITTELLEAPRGKQLRAYLMLYRLGIRLDDATDLKIEAELRKLVS